ncbi:MAG: helix-turn-helix domain-containing protein [Rhodobacteraceae bacterium]|nr:helix-turn-helix domain-containing protein [Paracoccaceae bacterium]
MTHLILTTDLQISAYLHRRRMDILAALRSGSATVSQIAAALKVHPANLTRHMRTLEKAGLIMLVEKRDTGRNLEKYYAAIASSFDIAPEGAATSLLYSALTMLRSDISAALARLPEEPPGPAIAKLAYAKISPQRVEEFSREITRLIDAFESDEEEDAMPYHLNLSLYPSDLPEAPTQSVILRQEPSG